ncbi:MAG: pyruvate kinase [Candidatus Cyclobacteriaceae bacterium M3_2C_046]
MRKKTKIVATISDKNCDIDFINRMYDCGMNVVRLNTAHQTHEDTLKVVNNVRAVSDKIALLLDTKGPEIRTTTACEDLPVTNGDIVFIKGDPTKITCRNCIYVSYEGFVDDVPVSSNILIDDGSIELKVKEKNGDELVCEVMNSGVIQGRKSVNIPSVYLKLPPLSQKDIDFIHFAIKNDLDFIAHSFVRHKEDVLSVQKILDEYQSKIKIIAKIENQEGVDNIDEILDYAYGIMIARGDLAVEIPQERIPGVQKMLINKCISRRKPVITATQMLHSMIDSPRPTRAEISDVANAIYDGTDAIMLSGETAYGKYPLKSIETMSKIALEVEKNLKPLIETSYFVLNNKTTAFLAETAVKAAVDLEAEAIIADTSTGRTIRGIAAFRGQKIIFAQCYDKKVMRELTLSYGVLPNFMKIKKSNEEFINDAMKSLLKRERVKNEDLVVILGGNFGPGSGASFIEISTVEKMLQKSELALKRDEKV